MTYYKDLSIYEYIARLQNSNILNIGWLDRNCRFSIGKVDDCILEILFNACKQSVNKTRGYHLCPLCDNPQYGQIEERNGEVIKLGSAEIWVKGEDCKVYVAPNMIYHYIIEHDYFPPNQFLEALKKGKLITQTDQI